MAKRKLLKLEYAVTLVIMFAVLLLIIPFDIEARNLIGRSISPECLENVGDYVADLLENQERYIEQIEKIRNERLYNIGYSGKAGGEYIIESLKKKQSVK